MPDLFQIDLGQTKWRPGGVQALLQELGRAFETRVGHEEVEFYGADSSAERLPLSSDEDVQSFCGSEWPGNGGDTQAVPHRLAQEVATHKVIRAELSERVAAELRQPQRKLALLATGRQISKYAGEVSGRDAAVSLKLFDCGHFRLKEARLGGGTSPVAGTSPSRGAAVAEGRWERASKGIRLECLLTFPEVARRRPSDAVVTYEAVPAEARSAMLAFMDVSEELLQGALPGCLGDRGEAGCWAVQLQLEVDVVSQQTRARQREEDAEDDELQRLHRRSVLRTSQHRRPCFLMVLAKAQWKAAPPKRARPRRDGEDWEDDEPRWPMYFGIFLCILIIIGFAWVLYEERHAPEPEQDADEL